MEVLQIQSELDRMLELRDLLRPRRILEIGCWDGGTLKEWLAGNPRPQKVVAVSLEHRQPEAYAKWTQPGTDLVVGTGDSATAPMVELIRLHSPYDWAFIDGDHGYQAVNHDVAVVMPLIVKGGVLLLHDITPSTDGTHCGPLQVFEELQADGHRTEVFDVEERYPWTAGIGVVYL